MIPGTLCLATIVLSLRDENHSPIEARRINSTQESSWLPNRFCYLMIVGTSIESARNDEVPEENDRIVWAAVPYQ